MSMTIELHQDRSPPKQFSHFIISCSAVVHSATNLQDPILIKGEL